MRLLVLSLALLLGGCGRGQLAVGGSGAGHGPGELDGGSTIPDADPTPLAVDAGPISIPNLDGPDPNDTGPPGGGGVDAPGMEVEGADGAALRLDGDVFDGFILDKTSADLGTVWVGQRSTASFTLSYRYPGPRQLGIPVSGVPTIQLVGPDFMRGLLTGCSLSAGILDGTSCSISIEFRPRGPGVRRGRLIVSGMPGGIVSADLIGVGEGPGVLEVSPSGTVEFPATPVGNSTPEQVFTIRNVSGPQVVNLMVQFSLDENFTFFTDCRDVLPPASRCQARVAFAPREGGLAVASLQVSAGLQSFVVYLKGTGLAPPRLHIEPSNWNYGEGRVGEVVDNPVGFRVGNSGGIVTGAPAVAIEGPDAADFVLTFQSCMAPLGPSCFVDVDFKPSSPGNKTARLVVRAEPGGQVVGDLFGVAKP